MTAHGPFKVRTVNAAALPDGIGKEGMTAQLVIGTRLSEVRLIGSEPISTVTGQGGAILRLWRYVEVATLGEAPIELQSAARRQIAAREVAKVATATAAPAAAAPAAGKLDLSKLSEEQLRAIVARMQK